jgi:large subunit ribosomal protein L7A
MENDKLVIGKKQTKRLILKNDIQKVYIARDAEKHVTEDIIKICKDKNIDIIFIDKMKELGKICNIDINAAIAAVIK